MLDFFAIVSKSGMVLFVSMTMKQDIESAMNRLIRNVILEERRDPLVIGPQVLKFHLDNEFNLVYIVGYQQQLSLSYVDKFLSDVQLAFRDKFSQFDLLRCLQRIGASALSGGVVAGIKRGPPSSRSDQDHPYVNLVDFYSEFDKLYSQATKMQIENRAPKQMKTFQESEKSKKTVGSMIIKPETAKEEKKAKEDKKDKVKAPAPEQTESKLKKLFGSSKPSTSPKATASSPTAKSKEPKASKEPKKRVKESRVWGLSGAKAEELDFSKRSSSNDGGANDDVVTASEARNVNSAGDLNGYSSVEMQPDLEFEASSESEAEEEQVEVEEDKPTKKSGWFGSVMKSFSYNKVLTATDLEPVLVQLRDHLIAKNVAAEVSTQLCNSVSAKMEGQSVNTFLGLKGHVKNALEDSILRILSPNRNLNILRDIQTKPVPPYVITFCGVNGVGKSTNLAKIANWLIVNDVRVLVIACDTFRAGAIEQLRTHVRALKAIHESKDSKLSKIDLYDKGYGKDPAGIAFEAINHARNAGYGCCLVDTAGRMQDNEPLMKQLAKLIKINQPDLTLFVGEALVGNEAVDQLSKFNTALLDNGCLGTGSNSSSAINGIILTKFDTIDDQVGAAISMTYITGQPIVFVGVGQTYKDLKQLNAKAVVKALMK